MKQTIRGRAFVLGHNIDTDQIIPAEKLVLDPSVPEERRQYGAFALSGVPEGQSGLPKGDIRFVGKGAETSQYKIVIGGNNFGCGSSREHAPLALAVAGAEAVVAVSYARIFYRNSVNGGYLVPCESVEDLSEKIATDDEVEIDLQNHTLRVVNRDESFALKPLGDILPILEAGDIFAYARESGMLDR